MWKRLVIGRRTQKDHPALTTRWPIAKEKIYQKPDLIVAKESADAYAAQEAALILAPAASSFAG